MVSITAAGGVALCGRGDAELAKRLVNIPLWLLHGAKDDVIPVAGSRDMAAWIGKAGGKLVRDDELAGEGHMIHNAVYRCAAVWDWLLAQRRAVAAP